MRYVARANVLSNQDVELVFWNSSGQMLPNAELQTYEDCTALSYSVNGSASVAVTPIGVAGHGYLRPHDTKDGIMLLTLEPAAFSTAGGTEGELLIESDFEVMFDAYGAITPDGNGDTYIALRAMPNLSGAGLGELNNSAGNHSVIKAAAEDAINERVYAIVEEAINTGDLSDFWTALAELIPTAAEIEAALVNDVTAQAIAAAVATQLLQNPSNKLDVANDGSVNTGRIEGSAPDDYMIDALPSADDVRNAVLDRVLDSHDTAGSLAVLIKEIASIIDELTEDDVADGVKRLTTNALENSPTGGGGSGGLTAEQDAKLEDIHLKTQLLGTADAQMTTSQPTAATVVLKQGDQVVLYWTSDSWPSLADASVSLVVDDTFTGGELIDIPAVVDNSDPLNPVVYTTLTATHTRSLTPGVSTAVFDLAAVFSGGAELTLQSGSIDVAAEVA